MPAVCEVVRELYRPAPRAGVAAGAHRQYLGAGLRLLERWSDEASDDWATNVRQRVSEDNGRTWSDWETVYHEEPRQGEYGREQYPISNVPDPASGKVVQAVFQRIIKGDAETAIASWWKGPELLFWDHAFYQVSEDDARTWGPPTMLRYEDGPQFDPADWGNPEYLRTNPMYVNALTSLSDGRVAVSVTAPAPYRDGEDEKLSCSYPCEVRAGCVAGVICFIGRWSAVRNDYEWQRSQPVFVPRRISSRGMIEPDLSELRDGRLLLVMRGSNTEWTPGRKWMSTSDDGGLTWTPVTDLRYETGEQFYSPSSFPYTRRSSKTGKLYFIGNICDRPPQGNGPRYPLVIAEIDESVPAVKNDTVTVIDDRDPDSDAESVGIWGAPFEDRESLDFELFATRFGQYAEGLRADAYRYTLRF